MGFIEETGVAQQFRDSRITPIYEGTTAIQANDLIGRKLARDAGTAAKTLIAEMRALPGSLQGTPSLVAAAAVFSDAVSALERSVEYVVSQYGSEFKQVSVGAVPILKLFGIVAGGWQLLRSAAVASERLAGEGEAKLPENFYRAKIETAIFYAHHVLSQAPGLAHSIVHGAAAALAECVL
jgi:acyl-CoA dehydrogenase